MKIINFPKLGNRDKEIFLNLSKEIIKKAYNPYSKFYVASAVLTSDNKIFYGVNIETCAYTSLCAERVAIGNAVTNGFYEFKKIFILARSEYFEVKKLSGPCGICRQVIFEFSELINRDIKILISDSRLKKVLQTSIKEIHPISFGPRVCMGDYKKYLAKEDSNKFKIHSKNKNN